jgi:hypothetical protein
VCLDGLAKDMAPSKCAGQKKATLIDDDYLCLLRYSTESFFSAVDRSPVVIWVSVENATATEQTQFNSRLGVLMSNLTVRAAYASPRMFAAGEIGLPSFRNIFGVAQCTRDLAAGADDCNRCLTSAVASIPNCCDGRQGGRVIYRTCSIRFEVYQFYNAQAAEAAMSPAPAPGCGSVNGSDHSGPGSNGESKVSDIL